MDLTRDQVDAQALGEHPELGVKLWPTLVVMHDGSEVAIGVLANQSSPSP